MKNILLTFSLMSVASVALAQNYHEDFQTLFKKRDTAGARKLLTEWETSNPNDPELYVSAVNFYFTNSKQAATSIDQQQTGKQSLQITDSTGKVVGYLNSSLGYRPDQLTLALHYISRGIERFPDRLDMRFGKCYVLGEIAAYDDFTSEVIKTVGYSVTIRNNWLWSNNKKLDDAEQFMLGTIQKYLRQLYETQDDSLLENMKRIGEVTLKYYPDNVEILSTTAVANMLTHNYDVALGYLKRAETINPKDFIVLNNIAQGYKMKGDKANAIKYYELTEKYGDDDAKRQARENIEELKK